MRKIVLSLIAMAAITLGYAQNNSKTLVVYYSRSGNTEAMANQIQKLTGADIVRIETVKTYPEEYKETTEIAKEELNKNARPAIKGKVDNINQYETIFIGFPIWWGTHPMVIATFLESYNLDGKTIIPFCTHGGGGVEKGFTDVNNATPKSTHKKGLSLNGSKVGTASADIEKWLREIKSIK